ncbi:hypothetical protein K1719_036655 [Acacia pycnantha]|nr:hypothetical protein K1719_036655 [Acacia pycnantha]
MRKDKRTREMRQKVDISSEEKGISNEKEKGSAESKGVGEFCEDTRMEEDTLVGPSSSEPPNEGIFSSVPIDPGERGGLGGIRGKFWVGPSVWGLECVALYWNCCGACGRNLTQNLRTVCIGLRPMIIILAETKCENEDWFEDLKRMGYDSLAVVPSVGRSGGMMAAWRRDRIVVMGNRQEQQLFHLHCVLEGRCPFFLTAIYAIPRSDSKQIIWEELKHIASSTLEPWVAMVDFNDISSFSERIGGAVSNEICIRRFNDRLYGCRLTDLGYVGPKFTWRGPWMRHYARLYERLDRAVANDAFIGAF